MAKADYISYIKDLLKEFGTDRAKIWDKVQKWDKLGQIEPISFSTFKRYYLDAKDSHLKYVNEKDEQKDKEGIKGDIDRLKQGLKHKDERVAEKQKDVESLRQSVYNGFTNDYYISNGEHVLYVRPMTEVEKATILKRASEIEAEISKIESDYAPTKVANTDSDGKDKPTQKIELPNGALIDLS